MADEKNKFSEEKGAILLEKVLAEKKSYRFKRKK